MGSGRPPQLHTGYLAARPQSSVLVECYILQPGLFFPETLLELLTTSAPTPLGPSCLMEVTVRTRPEMRRREGSQAQALTCPSWLAGPHYDRPRMEKSPKKKKKKNLGLRWENHLFSSFSILTISPSFHPYFLNLYVTAATRKGLTGGL